MHYFLNIVYLISHFYLMLFFCLFIPRRFSKMMTAGICFLAYLFLVTSDCVKLNIFSGYGLCYIIVTLLQIIVVQFTGIFISRKRDSKALYMALTASNYVIAGTITAIVIHICTGNIPLSLAGSFVVHLVILLILYHRIRTLCLAWCERDEARNWWELCLIPVFFYTGFSFLAFFPHSLYDNPANIIGTVIFIITMFVSYIITLRYVESESSSADIYWKNVLFESYIKGLESQYHLVERSERNLRILRHDMRHYSSMIDALLTQGEYDEIRKITLHIHEVTEENKVPKYCHNIVLNSILTQVMERASALGITVHPDIILPRELPVNDYEFASVIANLFENAFLCIRDFEKEKRYVDVTIRCETDHLLVRMENRYENEIRFDPVTGLPKSQKGRNHGLGMQSISAFADKIGGNINCLCENGVFLIVLFAKFQV